MKNLSAFFIQVWQQWEIRRVHITQSSILNIGQGKPAEIGFLSCLLSPNDVRGYRIQLTIQCHLSNLSWRYNCRRSYNQFDETNTDITQIHMNPSAKFYHFQMIYCSSPKKILYSKPETVLYTKIKLNVRSCDARKNYWGMHWYQCSEKMQEG